MDKSMIAKKFSKCIDRDFESVDEIVGNLKRSIKQLYDDERLLNVKVEDFIEEVALEIKRNVKRIIEFSREEETNSCKLANSKGSMISDGYESQDRVVDRKLENILGDVAVMLEKMRCKVENKGREESDIYYATRRKLEECREEIMEGYKNNSKKMMIEIEAEEHSSTKGQGYEPCL